MHDEIKQKRGEAKKKPHIEPPMRIQKYSQTMHKKLKMYRTDPSDCNLYWQPSVANLPSNGVKDRQHVTQRIT